MRSALPLLVYLSACTYYQTAPDDAGAPHDARPATDSSEDAAASQDASHDAMRDVVAQADAGPADSMHDAFIPADTAVQTDAPPQSDTLPPPCGRPGEPCCPETPSCDPWWAVDHSAGCDPATFTCYACGALSEPCCPYLPRCASWLLCITSSAGTKYCK